MRYLTFLAALILLSCCHSSSAPPSRGASAHAADTIVTTHDFETAFGLTGLPRGWQLTESHDLGLRSAWGAARGRQGGRAFAVLDGRGFGRALHVALMPERPLHSGSLRLSLRVLGGEERQGGGAVLWRDAQNHELVLWDALRSELCVQVFEMGEQRRALRKRLPRQVEPWRTLTISWTGSELTAEADGTSIRAHLGPGVRRLGLAVPGDAETAFDDLQLWRRAAAPGPSSR